MAGTVCTVCITYTCVIWNTDVGRTVKYSTLLLVRTQRTCNSSSKIHNKLHPLRATYNNGMYTIYNLNYQLTDRAQLEQNCVVVGGCIIQTSNLFGITSAAQRMVAVVRATRLPAYHSISTPLHIWTIVQKHSIRNTPISDDDTLEPIGCQLENK